MHGGLLIRDYIPEDWNAIADIHDRARLDELWLTVGVDAFRRLVATADTERFFDGRLFVAILGGALAGFVGIHGREISWLYVDPDHYRRGIGRRLLRHAIAMVPGPIEVSVLVGNDPALALYRSEGFMLVETLQGNLGGFEDLPARGHVLRRGADG